MMMSLQRFSGGYSHVPNCMGGCTILFVRKFYHPFRLLTPSIFEILPKNCLFRLFCGLCYPRDIVFDREECHLPDTFYGK